MDLIHYHPDVNKTLVELIPGSEYKVTLDNKNKLLNDMKELTDKCVNEYAPIYFNEN